MKSKDYVFTEREGELVFVGDFDGYYNDCDDPWEQSGVGGMASYYEKSRARMLETLGRLEPVTILEVGCGLGYTTNRIASACDGYEVTGCDISSVALSKASALFPQLRFEQWDIGDQSLCKRVTEKFDVVILNQLLWYVLEDLDSVFANVYELLNQDGKLLIVNAFARIQRYGIAMVDGYSGAVKNFMASGSFHLTESHYYDQDDEHADGQFLLYPRRV